MNGIADINWLYYTYYRDFPELRHIVLTHSRMVAKKALEITEAKKLRLDRKQVYIAAMLHDIGVVKCNAPDIKAFGDLPYLQHGIEGKKILEKHKLFTFAKVCERHIGAGLSAVYIEKRNLPLPKADMLPVSLLEKLICYADKFYSKSHDLQKEKTLEEVISQMKRYGDDSFRRFMEMHLLFSLEN